MNGIVNNNNYLNLYETIENYEGNIDVIPEFADIKHRGLGDCVTALSEARKLQPSVFGNVEKVENVYDGKNKYCESCGAVIKEKSSFCSSCGAKIRIISDRGN